MHRGTQLFLYVYLDDLKVAGNKTNLAKMWEIIGTKMEIERPVELIGNVYVGCG